MGEMRKYRVHLHSVPGHHEHYDGHVDVHAMNEIDAEERAFARLKDSYPERTRTMWRISATEDMGV